MVWTCASCTYVNSGVLNCCEICETPVNDTVEVQCDALLAKAIQEMDALDFFPWKLYQNQADLSMGLSFPVGEQTGFLLTYSKPALRRWVEQDGRTCGAASVASALNALSDKDKFNQEDILKIYRRNLRKKIKLNEKRFQTSATDGTGPLRNLIERQKRGYQKLNNASTAFIGNAELLRGARAASTLVFATPIHATTLIHTMQKNSWALLQEAMQSKYCQVIFHCTNHYSLIFAMREWIDCQGQYRRQILTATYMQAPAVWMAWEEVARIIKKWKGYRILLLRRAVK